MILSFFALLALDIGGAARELAHSVAAAAAREPVTLTIHNQSTLGAGEIAGIQRVFESELKVAATAAVNVRLTISANLTQYLLVAEVLRGTERHVVVESWPRAPAMPAAESKDASAHVTLEKRLLWEEDQAILDAARAGDAIIVLDPTQILLVRGGERQAAPLPATHPLPRDGRGRLVVDGQSFTAWLPGMICRGGIEPPLSLQCSESQEPWPVAPGATAVFVATANYFDGHVSIAGWGERTLAPFYSAASVGDTWIFAGVDGRARIYNRSGSAGADMDQWGSDIASVQTPCGARVLAARSAGAGEPDGIQPLELAQGTAIRAGAAVEFPGPVTALWSNGESARVVTRDLQTGHYAVYSLVPVCGL